MQGAQQQGYYASNGSASQQVSNSSTGGPGTPTGSSGSYEATVAAGETKRNFTTAATAITAMYQAQKAVYYDGVNDTLAKVRELLQVTAARNQLNGYVHVDQLLGAISSLSSTQGSNQQGQGQATPSTPPPTATATSVSGGTTGRRGNSRKRGPSHRDDEAPPPPGVDEAVPSAVQFDLGDIPPQMNRRRVEH